MKMIFFRKSPKLDFLKQDEKGVAAMCKIMEDMRNEAAQNKEKRAAVHLIKLGKMTLEEELESQSMQLA